MFSINRSSTETDGPTQNGTAGAPGERRRSVLHEGITITGDWTSDGIVEFGGTIIGDLTVDTLVVVKGGRIEGNVRARNVTLEGALTGTVSAITVTLKPSAEVKADIACNSMAIESGAQIDGKLTCKPR